MVADFYALLKLAWFSEENDVIFGSELARIIIVNRRSEMSGYLKTILKFLCSLGRAEMNFKRLCCKVIKN